MLTHWSPVVLHCEQRTTGMLNNNTHKIKEEEMPICQHPCSYFAYFANCPFNNIPSHHPSEPPAAIYPALCTFTTAALCTRVFTVRVIPLTLFAGDDRWRDHRGGVPPSRHHQTAPMAPTRLAMLHRAAAINTGMIVKGQESVCVQPWSYCSRYRNQPGTHPSALRFTPV